jgi:tetratricopeptide (TPR) repeat protein
METHERGPLMMIGTIWVRAQKWAGLPPLALQINPGYTEAIRLDPQYANAYYNRGRAYRKRGLYEQAIEDFDAYIRLDPDDAGAFFERAYTYDELGQYQRAIDDLNEAIRLDLEYAVAYNNRGVAYQNLGHQEQAEQDFAKAKELGYDP